MSTEQNKELVRQINEEVIDRGNVSLIDEIMALDYVGHPTPPGIPPGREGFKMLYNMWSSAFSDIKTTIHDMIAEGDKVAASVTHIGTHNGEFMGVPPTGKRISIEEMMFMRIAGGKIAEYWGQVDNVGLMQQLGAMPTPGASGS